MAAILLTLAAIAAVSAATNLIGRKLAPPVVSPAQDQMLGKDRPVEKLSLSRPSWERGGGLMVGALTLRNGNHYSVSHVIIACDFFDASGKLAGTRGTAIRGIFARGETPISGIEFVRRARDLEGGTCRTLSAKAAGLALQDDMD
jgi:hypothetical protein